MTKNKINRILIVSNGHGEDMIGGRLAKAFQDHQPSAKITVFPLVGDGSHYKNIENIRITNIKKDLPSGGFLRSITAIYQDLGSGLISHINKQVKLIKEERQTHDLVIMGDIFALLQDQENHLKQL